MGYESFNNLTGGLANIATAIGILVGGGWVLWRFWGTRESYPRAKLTHQLFACTASDDTVLLRVLITVNNDGTVALNVGKMLVQIQRIAPCDAQALASVRNDKHKEEADWPEIGRKSVFDAKCIIEPGENEQFPFDFVIARSIEVVSIYTHVDNRANPGRGWTCSTWAKPKELMA